MSQPFVSVVTPFHNTAPYLAQCIESVLAQSYSRFEYILVDNCSTDRSGEIAQAYAARDHRIRLIRRTQLVSQVQNYNSALMEISGVSEYCKVVQADDFIFPECLQLMVKTFEQSASIGLVSSYWLKGNTVRGSGFPFPISLLPGKKLGRLFLRTGLYVFGSPTTVMYRSSVVRTQRHFYDESLLHEDTEKCMQILENWDFGFVHQVLSFLRTDNQSISSATRTFEPNALDRYILVKRYAGVFLDAPQAVELRKKSQREYYRVLANGVLRLRGSAFWHYHIEGLESLGETLTLPGLALRTGLELLWMAANPGTTALRVIRSLKRNRTQESGIRRSPPADGTDGKQKTASSTDAEVFSPRHACEE